MKIVTIIILLGITSCQQSHINSKQYQLLSYPKTNQLDEIYALSKLEIFLNLTVRLNETGLTNKYEDRVLDVMRSEMTPRLYKALLGYVSKRKLRKKQNTTFLEKRLSLATGKNWVMLWARGFHTIQVKQFYRDSKKSYILELNCELKKGKIDIGYINKTKLIFSKVNGELKLANVYVERREFNGSKSRSNLMDFLKSESKNQETDSTRVKAINR